MTPSTQFSWSDQLEFLRCVCCGGKLRELPSGLACNDCQHEIKIIDGLLVTSDHFEGNNKIAADFYDSPRWHRYRFWKRFTPFNEKAVNKWRAEVFQHLPDLTGSRLLDVAIGAGLTVPLIPENCSLIGIDISIQQLRDCQRNNPTRAMGLILGEAEQLPFADNTFDNVVSFGAFNYFSDPLASLQEMARVVVDGGVVVVTDEYPNLPKTMIGHRIGWPGLDRWILSHLLHLGNDFASLINDHCELQIEPIIDQVLSDWSISDCCNQAAYCVVGRARK